MPSSISIVVIDDHPLLREGVCGTLAAVDGFEVVGDGENYQDALRIAHQTMPDIIILDISMPGGGVEAARDIHDALPVVKIIMLTASEDEKDVVSALQAGASAYILKGIGGRNLADIVKRVSAGESFITPGLAASLLLNSNKPASAQHQKSPIDNLTERERSILMNLELGLTNKQIAVKLSLSEKTIKHYMTNILQKLQVKNRVEAALMAQKATY